MRFRARGIRGLSGVDILGDLNSVIQWSKDTVQNALPTWAGGTPLTPDQLSAIQSQAAQDIHVAAAGNVELENQAIAQMMNETTDVYNQAYAAAAASDTGSSSGSSLLFWAFLGIVGLVVFVRVVK